MRRRLGVLGGMVLSVSLTGRAVAQPGTLLDYRVGLLEEAVKAITWQHAWLAGLLIANLVAVLVSLTITLVTRKRR